jgi:hypothetical protein
MIRTGIPGELPMDAMMVFGADATFAPANAAPLVAGFSRAAPATVKDMVEKLAAQGKLPQKFIGNGGALIGSIDEIWSELPDLLKRRAMNEASAPFTTHAKGLVVSEGAAAMPWVNFRKAIELGLWPSSRLLGIHGNAGEGGAPDLASMDQGIVTATMVAMNMAKAHGVPIQVIQTHGTSTALNSIAEITSIHHALRYLGVSEPMAISAIKGLVGHTMGAAGAVDMVMGVHSLLEQKAPGLFNFRSQDIDPRFAERIPEALRQLQFSSDPIQGPIDGILMTSQGFLSSDAAAVLGRFPQDVEAGAELLRDYNFAPHVIADWKAKAPEMRARAEEQADALRRRRVTHRDIAATMGFNTPK